MRILEPEQTMRLDMRLEVIPIVRPLRLKPGNPAYIGRGSRAAYRRRG